MDLQKPLSLETVHEDGTESEANDEVRQVEALVATSCLAVLWLPLSKASCGNPAFDISSRHGIPQGP